MNKAIFKLAVPNIITNITVPLLGLVDLALMGQLGNPVFIGAIALGSVIFNLVYSGFGFLRMGTTGFTAQFFGADNKQELSLTLWRSLLVAIGIGLIFIVLQKPIELISFYLLDGSDQVKELAKGYYRIRIWAAPATLGLYALYGWFLGMQNAKPPMIIAISINVINIILNFVFVYWFNMTSNGVAYASVIAQYSGLFIGFVFLALKYPKFIKWLPYNYLLDPIELKKFFKVNTDIFLRSIALMLTFTLFTAMSAKMGDNILAVNSLLIQFLFIFSYFTDGFAFAGEAMVGKAYGGKNLPLLRKTVKHLFYFGWLASFIFSIIYFFGSDIILSILTNNEEIISQAYEFRWWVIILPITTLASFIWDGIYIGLTASKKMRDVMLISTFVFFLPSYYIGTLYFENHGLWFALNFFMAIRSLLMWKSSKRLLGKL